MNDRNLWISRRLNNRPLVIKLEKVLLEDFQTARHLRYHGKFLWKLRNKHELIEIKSLASWAELLTSFFFTSFFFILTRKCDAFFKPAFSFQFERGGFALDRVKRRWAAKKLKRWNMLKNWLHWNCCILFQNLFSHPIYKYNYEHLINGEQEMNSKEREKNWK